MSRDPPLVILVASAPRSGGTWLFNVVRGLLKVSGVTFHSAWVTEYQRHEAVDYHLIKAHRPEQVDFQSWKILTTYREISERLASLVRIGWLQKTRSSLAAASIGQQQVYDYWHARSDFEAKYKDIVDAPEQVITDIAELLGLTVDEEYLGKIADDLRAMTAPVTGSFDPVTLLHPNHRDTNRSTDDIAAEIRRLLADC